MTQPLNNQQLMALLQNGPVLDSISTALPNDMQARLIDLQRRAADSYAAGSWAVPSTGASYAVPIRSLPVTREQAQAELGAAYMAIDTKRQALRHVMDEMGLNPSAQRGLVGQIMDNIQGLFR